MQQLAPIEQSLAKLFQGFPNLPKNVREWIADNAWWLVIIGVVLGGLAVLGLASALFFGTAVTTMFLGPLGGVFFLPALIHLAILVVTILIEVSAIEPLKAKQKRGWSLIFLSSLISIAASLLNIVLTGDLNGILGLIIGALISFYVLFEVRSYFVEAKPADKKV